MSWRLICPPKNWQKSNGFSTDVNSSKTFLKKKNLTLEGLSNTMFFSITFKKYSSSLNYNPLHRSARSSVIFLHFFSRGWTWHKRLVNVCFSQIGPINLASQRIKALPFIILIPAASLLNSAFLNYTRRLFYDCLGSWPSLLPLRNWQLKRIFNCPVIVLRRIRNRPDPPAPLASVWCKIASWRLRARKS